jgi:hypothetical protein
MICRDGKQIKIAIFMLKIRSKVCCLCDIVGSDYTCFSAYSLPARSTPQQTEQSGAKFKILKCSKQTLSPFPQHSTLVVTQSQ